MAVAVEAVTLGIAAMRKKLAKVSLVVLATCNT